MKYESENLRITELSEVEEEIEEQVTRVRDAIFTVLQDENIRYDVALSIFATMYARVACDHMELPQKIAHEAITKTLELYYKDDFNETGEVKWLN
jgi:hypothetical protein